MRNPDPHDFTADAQQKNLLKEKKWKFYAQEEWPEWDTELTRRYNFPIESKVMEWA